jgi:hypothetical protein
VWVARGQTRNRTDIDVADCACGRCGPKRDWRKRRAARRDIFASKEGRGRTRVGAEQSQEEKNEEEDEEENSAERWPAPALPAGTRRRPVEGSGENLLAVS